MAAQSCLVMTLRGGGWLLWRWRPALVALLWIRVEGEPWWRTHLTLAVRRPA